MRPTTLLVVACLLATSARSQAQADGAGARSVAEADRGLELYEEGKWLEARARFRAADALYHSPVFALYGARCLERAGRWTQALGEYQRISAEVLPATAPTAWREAVDAARAARGSLAGRIPRVVIVLEAAPPAARVRVDGRAVAAGVPIRLDPGPHVVVAVAGSVRIERRVELAPGGAPEEVRVRFARVRTPAAARRAPGGPGAPALVVGGVAIAAVLAGGVAGIGALQRASDAKEGLPESCDGSRCPVSRRDEIEGRAKSAHALADLSTGLLLGGAVVLAAEAVWWFTRPRPGAR